MKVLHWLILGSVLVVGTTMLFSDEPARGNVPRGLEDLVTRYVEAFTTGSLADIADLTHPDDVSRAEGTVISMAAGCVTAEELDELGFGDVSELYTLETGELIRRVAASEAPIVGELPPAPSVQVLGQIKEGDLRHVVYRTKAQGDNDIILSEIHVMTAKKYRGQWRATLKDDLAAALLHLQIEMEKSCAKNDR